MRKAFAMLVATLMVMSLAACGSPAKKHSYRSIKCPACGYQFDVPSDG